MTTRSKHNSGDTREPEFVVLVVLDDGNVGWAHVDSLRVFTLVDSILEASVMSDGLSFHAGNRLSRNRSGALVGTHERLELLPGESLQERLLCAARNAAELALLRQGRPGLQRWRASNELKERAFRKAIEEVIR